MRKLIFVLGVLVVLLVVADRTVPLVAGSVVADQVQKEASLPSKPDVTFHHFPFLTQAIGGDYHDVEVEAHGVPVKSVGHVDVDAHFQGLHASLGDVIGGNIDEIPVDDITASAEVPYADLVKAADVGGGVRIDSIQRDGDGVRVRASTELLGQNVTATARATVRVRGQSLVVTAGNVTSDDLPPGAPGLSGLASELSFDVPMDDLPYGLRVTGVHLAEHGASVSAEVHDVLLGSGGIRPRN